ncbi:hypothetical protein HMSSN139_39070 [Paenibacillus sp. HMSSN-139]|nr:hypothetical protein HMSSN139_39070 [Paenibacillus sp. HMSSN-139]
MKKLPQEDMQILTVALEGGLTETEMINIEQILSKHLDKTEYAKVMELLKKVNAKTPVYRECQR